MGDAEKTEELGFMTFEGGFCNERDEGKKPFMR